MSLLARLAGSARPAVFVVAGDGGRGRARRLLADPRVEVVASPRHATVLVQTGALPGELGRAAQRVHDQLPVPRAVVVFGDDVEALPVRPEPIRIAGDDDPVRALRAAQRALFAGERPSSDPLGPADSPIDWQGVGPHGQGGEGMMGGKPYGRAMAMTGDDLRDGLSLDRVTVPLGPLLPWMPPGLRLLVVLQGDLVQELSNQVLGATHRDLPPVFVRAEREEVPVAELELARARHHLAATAELLRLHQLDALALRTFRAAEDLTPGDPAPVQRLAGMLRRSGALRLGTRDVGVLSSEQAAGLGPVARASGNAEDARANDPAYEGLEFQVCTEGRGDAEARWRQRLAEAAQAIALAGRAEDRVRAPGPSLEGPRGPLAEHVSDRALDLLEEVAVGRPFDALVTTLVSLDLDLAGHRAAAADGAEGSARA